MSRTVCSWCHNPLVLKDDVLVCKNIDCDACDEKFLHKELIRTRKALDVAVDALDAGRTLARIAGFEMLATGMDEAVSKITATLENKNGNC